MGAVPAMTGSAIPVITPFTAPTPRLTGGIPSVDGADGRQEFASWLTRWKDKPSTSPAASRSRHAARVTCGVSQRAENGGSWFILALRPGK
jgi:hypothetical protein